MRCLQALHLELCSKPFRQTTALLPPAKYFLAQKLVKSFRGKPNIAKSNIKYLHIRRTMYL
jgi:hypothetical protein